jgi:hypothetical protein
MTGGRSSCAWRSVLYTTEIGPDFSSDTFEAANQSPFSAMFLPQTKRCAPRTTPVSGLQVNRLPFCATSHLTPHTSHLTPHTSHLTPHTSHLTPHTSLLLSTKVHAPYLTPRVAPHTTQHLPFTSVSPQVLFTLLSNGAAKSSTAVSTLTSLSPCLSPSAPASMNVCLM